MSLLTDRQKGDLTKAILEFLEFHGYQDSYQTLKKEAGVDPRSENNAAQPRYTALLEKKWTSVVRLQKKILDLESKVATLTEELSTAIVKKPSGKDGASRWPHPPEKMTLVGHRMSATCVCFHPALALVVSGSEDTTIKVWDVESGSVERTLKGHTKTIHAVAFDIKGQLLVSVSSDSTIKLWDFTRTDYPCVKTLYGHDHSVSSIEFIPGGEKIITSSRDKTIKVWEVSSGYCIKTFSGYSEWVRDAKVSCDSRWLLCCTNEVLILRDFETEEVKLELRGHSNVVECIVILPSNSNAKVNELLKLKGEVPSIGSDCLFALSGSRDKTIILWDLQTGQPILTFVGHDNWVRGIQVEASGANFLSVSDDKTMRIWDLSSGRCLKSIMAHDHFVTGVAWHPQLPMVATSSVDQTLRLWECR